MIPGVDHLGLFVVAGLLLNLTPGPDVLFIVSQGLRSGARAGIVAALGGKIIRAQQLMHGKTSSITTTQQGVFAGLPKQFTVNRYHSLAIERASCPADLEITAWTDDGEIMGVRHKGLASAVRLEGVQFHPESILTEHGHAMLRNFLELQ